ncbi:PadR family transcriptional regulator [Rhodobacteraceae bacterium RKSG542]|uniref:PadR family transcriptional regulator n=1 Tax=Pseudovibrio flavus TaxID=2529854 RepID=UPI0012BB4ABF|nr:PadR family transcriptional regulator [Pseudovibrio flavus]MTI16718.1 PadR family transcriptional regulator [Pseudovibrio flavus]
MSTRKFCLAVLFCHDATGYEIRRIAGEGRFAFITEAGYGSIYPCLSKLESEGLVTVSEEFAPSKPPKKIYSITNIGKEAFVNELMELPAHDTFRSPFLLVSLFAQYLDADFIARAIDAREAYLRDKLSELRAQATECCNPASQWTMEYGITTLTASLEYLQKHRSRLEEIAREASSQPQAAE